MNDIVKEKDSRKRRIAKISAVFLGMMVLLTFFSNTINNFSLPRVKTEQPLSNCLVKEVSASGTIEARKTINIYSQSTRKVRDVYVKKGEKVQKGDPLILFDSSDLEETLKEEAIMLEKAKLSLDKLVSSSIQENLAGYERDINEAKEKISEAEKALEDAKDLYDAGVLSGNDLAKAQKDLDTARKDYEQKLEDYNGNIKENLKKTGGQKLDIKDRELDLKLQQLKVDRLKKELALGNRIDAPCSGIVKEVGIEKGSMPSANSMICSIVDTSAGFEFIAAVDSESVRLVNVGDPADIALESSNGRTMEGKLVEIRNNIESNGNRKELVISVPQGGLGGGEAGEFTISNRTKVYDVIIPNSCIGQDDKGKFVYVLKEKKGPLGNEYYVQRVSVAVVDHDNFNSAIQSGIGPNEQVVTYSSKDNLDDGCRVMPER